MEPPYGRRKCNGSVVIAVGIVTLDFHDFGDEAPARAALQVHDNAKRISGVGLDRSVWQVNSALENAAGESCEGLPS
ncbi:MAG TPA: hypothetical protein VKQ28_07945 [Candidatus Acidoferrum sp.]|nr:hypothetical protein [Candidatus Acidoferrum sp.]